MKTTIWHNPRCSKSREAVNLVEESGQVNEVVKYLDKTLTTHTMKNMLKMLGFKSAREWMRTTEAIYKELDLKNVTDEDALIEAMIQNPKLIQRPVLIRGDNAIIGRPESAITDFLKDGV
ncbi:arsenate reductase (glutaredoxin) [Sulfurimonas sp. SAG-AH-194-C20]|nr:arsenate reductase (glutaredoxin) [Sulfurimonas sp. SAG-AH-194-C20]MDF1878159.1 arsenate reductase (glutaredoxin) [Sulfurimonas sp. SAG-AH-194-C20]